MSLEKWTAPYVDIQNSYLNIFIFIFIFTSLYLLTFTLLPFMNFYNTTPLSHLNVIFLFLLFIYLLYENKNKNMMIFMNKKTLQLFRFC